MKNPTETELIIKKPRATRVKKQIEPAPELEALEKPIDMGRNPHAYNYGVDPNAETEVHLLDYWRAVRKRLWLVVGMVVLVTMMSVIYVARKPDIYQASARVQVNLENNADIVGARRLTYLVRPTIRFTSIRNFKSWSARA